MTKISIYDFTDYRDFLKSWIASVPEKSRGQLARISEAGNVHKTTLSQVFHGSKDLSLEQAQRIGQYLGLNFGEIEFFLLLVNFSRAGTTDLKDCYSRQIEARRKNHQQLSNRVSRTRDLSSEERSIYYSNWIYSAVRNLSAIESFRTPSKIAAHLGIDPSLMNQVLDFLLNTGLCVQDRNGIRPGPQMTHLEAASPLVSRHHGNWRIKAMERHPMLRMDEELAYTAPMTLSVSDVEKIRALLADVVQRTDEIVGPSKSEKLYCMCLDWFEVK
jgi:uncharacterized protein (TIGR02147 family)